MSELTAYERWMVRSNLEHIANGESAVTIIATLRSNGYEQIASAVLKELGSMRFPRGEDDE